MTLLFNCDKKTLEDECLNAETAADAWWNFYDTENIALFERKKRQLNKERSVTTGSIVKTHDDAYLRATKILNAIRFQPKLPVAVSSNGIRVDRDEYYIIYIYLYFSMFPANIQKKIK